MSEQSLWLCGTHVKSTWWIRTKVVYVSMMEDLRSDKMSGGGGRLAGPGKDFSKERKLPKFSSKSSSLTRPRAESSTVEVGFLLSLYLTAKMTWAQDHANYYSCDEFRENETPSPPPYPSPPDSNMTAMLQSGQYFSFDKENTYEPLTYQVQYIVLCSSGLYCAAGGGRGPRDECRTAEYWKVFIRTVTGSRIYKDAVMFFKTGHCAAEYPPLLPECWLRPGDLLRNQQLLRHLLVDKPQVISKQALQIILF